MLEKLRQERPYQVIHEVLSFEKNDYGFYDVNVDMETQFFETTVQHTNMKLPYPSDEYGKLSPEEQFKWRHDSLKKKKVIERIPINIWDDYYEEGYIPEGEIQETYIYVEDSDLSNDLIKKCLEILLDYMNNNLKLDGVKMWLEYFDSKVKYPSLIGSEYEKYAFERWEIKVQHLTHERREKLVKELEKANLEIDGIPFEIYSES